MLNPTIDFHDMVEQADQAVTTLTPEQVNQRRHNDGVLLVDIRDIRELEREGRIPGSKHVPRGMLEFWIHPESPYFKEYFDQAEEIILHCNRGWRSALAAKALKDIGIDVAHMSGGFSQWLESKFDVEPCQSK